MVGGKSTKPSKLTEEITSRQPSLPIYIAAHNQAEEVLIKMGILQNAIINSTHFSSIATDEKGVIQLFNVGAEIMLGYMALDVINKFTPADLSDPLELIARAKALSLELGTTISPGFEALIFKASRGIEDIYELTYIRKDGSRFPAVVSVTALRDTQNAIIGYLLIGTDNTIRKQAELERDRYLEKVETANKALDAFSYSISHDLRAPLRAMDGFSRILLEEYASQLPAEAQRYLSLVRDNAQQMGHLIEDLLTFSRLSRQPLNKQTVASDQIVQQVLEDLRLGQVQRNVEITIGDLPACEADPELLKQVWVNLLSNALKFTGKCEAAHIDIGWMSPLPEGHRGGVTGEKPVEGCYFVKDNGVGFDMQYTDKLFGVFQRLHRAEEYEGTGVGLAIVQRIVLRHGGQIWAEAVVDKGATFFFTLEGGT
jgi:signal transduction histidine kinase